MRSYLSFRNQFETSSLVDRPLPVRGTLDHCCNLLCCEYLTMIAIREWQRRPGKKSPRIARRTHGCFGFQVDRNVETVSYFNICRR